MSVMAATMVHLRTGLQLRGLLVSLGENETVLAGRGRVRAEAAGVRVDMERAIQLQMI